LANLINNDTLVFRCPQSIREKLKLYADEHEMHISGVVRKAVIDFLKKEMPELFVTPATYSEFMTSISDSTLEEEMRTRGYQITKLSDNEDLREWKVNKR
jgi:hypothetical protein